MCFPPLVPLTSCFDTCTGNSLVQNGEDSAAVRSRRPTDRALTRVVVPAVVGRSGHSGMPSR
eukprot:1774467-Prymnesium_polylepis.1